MSDILKELEKIRELSDNLIGYIQAIDENNYSENLTKGNQVSEQWSYDYSYSYEQSLQDKKEEKKFK